VRLLQPDGQQLTCCEEAQAIYGVRGADPAHGGS